MHSARILALDERLAFTSGFLGKPNGFIHESRHSETLANNGDSEKRKQIFDLCR
jgi:hypothetical protein